MCSREAVKAVEVCLRRLGRCTRIRDILPANHICKDIVENTCHLSRRRCSYNISALTDIACVITEDRTPLNVRIATSGEA